jgi:hypothetical protein
MGDRFGSEMVATDYYHNLKAAAFDRMILL